jgi:hypothetical protein
MSRPREMIPEDLEVMKERYYADNGKLRAKINIRGYPQGSEVGSEHNQGYKSVRVNTRAYLVHRVAYFLETGQWPSGVIDHINGVLSDNRVENLRDVSQSENTRSFCRHRKNKTSRYRGVCLHKTSGFWYARIFSKGKPSYVGCYTCEREAALAWNYKALELGHNPQSFNDVFGD